MSLLKFLECLTRQPRIFHLCLVGWRYGEGRSIFGSSSIIFVLLKPFSEHSCPMDGRGTSQDKGDHREQLHIDQQRSFPQPPGPLTVGSSFKPVLVSWWTPPMHLPTCWKYVEGWLIWPPYHVFPHLCTPVLLQGLTLKLVMDKETFFFFRGGLPDKLKVTNKGKKQDWYIPVLH